MNPVRKKNLFIITAFSLFCIFSCSPKTGHKILTFLFDGVPEASEPARAFSADSLEKKDEPAGNEVNIIAEKPYVFHEPYLDKICDVCHNPSSIGELTMTQPDLCYQCHDDYSWEYKFVHGPVAGGYCTSCHNPHMSKLEYFLIKTGQDLCLNCHDRDQVFKNNIHDGIEDYACTECHNSHGGETWYFY